MNGSIRVATCVIIRFRLGGLSLFGGYMILDTLGSVLPLGSKDSYFKAFGAKDPTK